MQNVFSEITKWIIPFILTSIVTFIGQIAKEIKLVKNANESDHKAVHNGMLAILRSEIVSSSENYLSLGYLPDHARITLTELVNTYKELEGNHGIEKLAEQCFKLPPISGKTLEE